MDIDNEEEIEQHRSMRILVPPSQPSATHEEPPTPSPSVIDWEEAKRIHQYFFNILGPITPPAPSSPPTWDDEIINEHLPGVDIWELANAPLEVFPTPSPTLSAEDYEELYVPLSISPPTPPPNAFIDNDGFDILIYESEDEIDEIIDDHDVEQPPQLSTPQKQREELQLREVEERRRNSKIPTFNCVLCQFQYLHGAMTAPCGHIFCASCLTDWINQNSNCPLLPLCNSTGQMH